MSLPVFQSTIVTSAGDIIPSPVITVLVESTGLAASLFSDRNGSTALGTGGVFSGTVDGFAQFYASPDEYRVTASDAGSGFSQTWRYVVLSGTAATSNIQTSSTDTTAGALMGVRAFGVGSQDLSSYNPVGVADLNDALTPGDWKVASATTSNTPTGHGILTVKRGSSAHVWHTWLTMSGSSQVMYNRTSDSAGATWTPWQPVFTGASYQPDSIDGIGVVRLLKNVSGSNITSGQSVAGGGLLQVFINSAGVVNSSGTPTGTYKNVFGQTLANNSGSYFVRIA